MKTVSVKIVFPEKTLYMEMAQAPRRGDYIDYEMTGKLFLVRRVVFSTFSTLVTVYVEEE